MNLMKIIKKQIIKVLKASIKKKKRIKRNPIRKVAICGGAGDFMLPDALAAGADAFVTGEMHYHVFFDYEQKLQICVIGHYQSEQFTSEVFRDIINKECPDVRTEIAETNTNPIRYI